jgi:transcriptional regulator with XRE-family HTH domain
MKTSGSTCTRVVSSAGEPRHRRGQADFARLLGVSSLTVYNIEKGNTPRQKTLEAFGRTALLGKREAKTKLQALKASA